MRQQISMTVGCALIPSKDSMPPDKIANPIPPKMPGEYWSLNLPATGAIIATKTAQGVIKKPVSTGDRPSTVSKQKGNETNARLCVAKVQIDVTTDKKNIGR